MRVPGVEISAKLLDERSGKAGSSAAASVDAYLGYQKSFSIPRIYHERRSRILVSMAKRGVVSRHVSDCVHGRAQKLEPGKKITLDQQEDLDIKITGVTFDENLVDQGRTSIKVHVQDGESKRTTSFVLANLIPGKACQTYSMLAKCSLLPSFVQIESQLLDLIVGGDEELE